MISSPAPDDTSRFHLHLARTALLSAIVVYLFACPHTKVEESFNLHAIYDFVHNFAAFNEYDHHTFPGVVPRTCIGAVIVSLITAPFTFLVGLIGGPLFYGQLFCRAVLGFGLWKAFCEYAKSVGAKFGYRVESTLLFLTACQFHLPFYMSRTLPNTFALYGILHALASWIKSDTLQTLFFLCTTMVIFRCDTLVLIVPVSVQMIAQGESTIFIWILAAALSSTFALVLTLIVDSIFWQKLVWPEGVVLFSNTVQNKSLEYGVSSWHWYFSSAIPRAMGASSLLAICGFFVAKSVPAKNKEEVTTKQSGVVSSVETINYYALPVQVFVALYSFLPHKEMRFVFTAIPLLNTVAAIALEAFDVTLETKTEITASTDLDDIPDEFDAEKEALRPEIGNTWVPRLLGYTVRGLVYFGSLAFSLICLFAALQNYPGGTALQRVNDRIQAEGLAHDMKVHIDADAAMTGASLFGQLRAGAIYSKDESLSDFSSFDYLLTSKSNVDSFEMVDEINGNPQLNAINFVKHLLRHGVENLPNLFTSQTVLYVLKKKNRNSIVGFFI
jgi:alpha-1,6-mannosyltransferase